MKENKFIKVIICLIIVSFIGILTVNADKGSLRITYDTLNIDIYSFNFNNSKNPALVIPKGKCQNFVRIMMNDGGYEDSDYIQWSAYYQDETGTEKQGTERVVVSNDFNSQSTSSDDSAVVGSFITTAGNDVKICVHDTDGMKQSDNYYVMACYATGETEDTVTDKCASVHVFNLLNDAGTEIDGHVNIDGEDCFFSCSDNCAFEDEYNNCVCNRIISTGNKYINEALRMGTVGVELIDQYWTRDDDGNGILTEEDEDQAQPECYNLTESAQDIDDDGEVESVTDSVRDDSVLDSYKGHITVPSETLTKDKNVKNYRNVYLCDMHDVLKTFDILGRLLFIIKILVPVILILVSVKSLAVAVIYDDKTDLKGFFNNFLKKFILAVMVFFAPTLLKYIIGLAGNIYAGDTNYSRCGECLLDYTTCFEGNTYMLDEESGTSVLYEDTLDAECTSDSLLGDVTEPNDLAYYIQQGITIMKYLGIALCIIMTIVDIAGVILHEDKELIRPIVQKTISRIGYAVALIFLPEIIEIIGMLVGVISDCGIK